MPEKEIADQAVRWLPWLIGIVASIVGVGVRNEWTTNALKNAIFRPNGDVRLVRIRDCETCRQKCQEGVDRSLLTAKRDRERAQDETRVDIQRIHDQIDALPLRIITMMRETRRASDRPREEKK